MSDYSFSCTLLIPKAKFLFLERKEKEMVDLVFAFGSTGKDARPLFKKEKDAAKVMIDNEKEKDILYSTIVYGKNASLESKFTDMPDKAKVKEFIDKLKWPGEGRKLDHALVETDRVFKKHGRPKARKITVVFVTGQADATTSELKKAAKKLNDNGVKIVVVKLGTDPDDGVLEVITPKKNIVKKKKTVEPKELAEFVEEVVKKGRMLLPFTDLLLFCKCLLFMTFIFLSKNVIYLIAFSFYNF